MRCPRCRHETALDAAFCQECGASLEAACPGCGTPNAASARFCKRCGRRLGELSPAPGSRFGSPERYTPRPLADRILTSRSALEGERKQVTVLFADLKGSLELLAGRDPEEARAVLDPVLERMLEAVHRYEGTVNQVMGDGIMALFGAPLAHEDHAVRACYAALRMQESVRQYAEEARRAHGVSVQIRVGLNSGEVVVRAIGSDLRMDYTAVGETTHLAARMEQLARPGGILLTRSTLELVEGFVATRALGRVTVKGLPEAVEAHELTGAGPARTRFQAAARRGLTRFVGREAELEQLRRARQLAGSGHGQVVAVVGEAAVGKSRLVHEFVHSPHFEGWLILEVSAVSYGKARSYLPVIELLRAYFRIQDRDGLGEIREKVRGRLLALDPALEASLPALLALLDVPVNPSAGPAEAAWQALDPGQRRQRTLDAVRRLLLREARERPVLWVCEDLHWIDHETQAVLDALVDSLGSARLLLLVNYRPEYRHGWASRTCYSQVRLDVLPAESSGELLDALLGDDPGLAPLKQLLVKRGNPFFLEETVRTLVETSALAGEPGRYRLTAPVQALRVPPTVQAMLAARIDRLADDEKQLLQTASAVGKDVPVPLLQAIAGLPAEDLRATLARLQAAEFLYETGLDPDVEYTFKHALTHDVAYGSLLQDRRRALDARIVEALERLHSDRLAEHVERLAHHAVRGGVWGKAVTYLRQAGAKAFARSANRDAASYFEQALAALAHLPATRETSEEGVDTRLALRNALWPLGRFETGLEHLRAAEPPARELGDPRRLGWIAAYLSEHTRQTGHAADAPAFAERALTIAEALGDLSLRVAASYYLGTAYFVAGEYRRTDEFFGRILQWLAGDRFRERCGLAGFPAVMSRMFWPLALAERGEFDRGMAEAREGIRLAEALEHPYSLICAMRAVARLHGARGEFDQAIPVAEQSLAMSRERNLPQLSPEVADELGLLYARSGRAAEGLALLQEALAALESMGMFQWRSSVLVHLGETCLLAGRPEEALGQAERALALSRERGHRGSEAWTLRLLGEIASRQDPPDRAGGEARYRAALDVAAELGMRPLVAHCHLGLGRLLRGGAESRAAEEHLAAATTMYREMGMRSWLEAARTG